MTTIKAAVMAFPLLWGASTAHAQDTHYTVTIRNHQFVPSTLEVPAGKKISLIVRNEDKTAEEFESDDLRREKIIPAGKEITISIGPLKPGTYKFKGEFHEKTAQGSVVAK